MNYMKARQNRTLLAVIIFAAIVVGFMYWQYGQMFSTPPDATAVLIEGENGEAVPQEELGTLIGDEATGENQPLNAQRNFSRISADLFDCLDINKQNLPEALPVTVDAFIMSIQEQLGPSSSTTDHWMNWHLKTRDGQEKRIRLEVTENDEGKSIRELKHYALDKEGLPVPLELDRKKAMNPSNETLNQMLKEGEVFFKEKASAVFFPGGERLEYVEKNGELSELEFYRGDSFFRCQSLAARENCQCVR